jgi:hypothetical protein
MPKPSMTLGQGDEYELRPVNMVYSDPKLLKWRTELLEQAGFTKGEASTMARWRDVDVWKVREWIASGKCSHAQAMRICAPLIELPTAEQVEQLGHSVAA